MIVNRSSLLAVILPAILVTAHASWAADSGLWDGTWNGTLGGTYPWPVSITISQGKVAGFSEKGVPFDVRCTGMTLTAIYFATGPITARCSPRSATRRLLWEFTAMTASSQVPSSSNSWSCTGCCLSLNFERA